MTNTSRKHGADDIATTHAKSQKKISKKLESASNAQAVMAGFGDAYRSWVEALSREPQKLADMQSRFMQGQLELWNRTMQPKREGAAASVHDSRFSAPEWGEFPAFDYLRRSYLMTSKMLMESVDEAGLDTATRQRMRFFMRQYLDAMSPSNYLLTNPEALKMALATGGESLQEGMKNLVADVEKGQISITDESAFRVGENIAASEGAVVFENDLIQLIQYTPLTAKVFERPLLMVPPCINKFYLMDLQPENSFVRYAVEQGHTSFMVSWRNVKEDQGTLTWDEYIQMGVLDAIEAVQAITGAERINALGFCIGGTLLCSGLAVLARKKRHPVESLTLLTSLLDFTEVGEIRVYIDEAFVEKREKDLEKGGLVPGGELAAAFSSLRANDLVWNYVVNNYLKGKQPAVFDLLYWNGDATNLPGPMYAYYLRNTYQDNKLSQPDALTMCGVPVDLKRVKLPTYVFAAREDHIVPWHGAYLSALCLGGDVKFTLGASGHIAGTMNPAAKGKRSHWVNDALPADPAAWLAKAREVPGSWWTPWSKWMKPFGGKLVAAPKALGARRFPPIEKAPGRYVLEKA
jgi:polyhydroxyalkanoate synthase subunit PhaC